MLDKEFELKSEKHSFTNQVANDSKYLNTPPYSELEWNCIKRLLKTFKADGFITEGETLKILKGKSVVMYTHISELLKLELAEQELQVEFDKMLWGEDLEYLPKPFISKKFSKNQINKAIDNISKGFNPNSNKSKIEELPARLWKELEIIQKKYGDSLNDSNSNKIEVSIKYEKLFNKYKLPIKLGDVTLDNNIEYNNLIINKLNLAQDKQIGVYEVVGKDTKFSVDLLIELLQDGKSVLNTIDTGRPRLLFYDKYFEVGTEFKLKNGEIWTKDKNNFGYRFKNGKVIDTINWIES